MHNAPPNDTERTRTCPLCGRVLVPGPSVQSHHLTPKSRGGGPTVVMHAVCHQMLHKVFSESALTRLACFEDGGWASIGEHPEITRFKAWVSKKPPEFTDRPRTRGRRPYHRARR